MRSDRVLAREVGAALKRLRGERQLARYMLADLAGITREKLVSYEQGRRCPSLLALVKILAALGFSWQDFGRSLAPSHYQGDRR